MSDALLSAEDVSFAYGSGPEILHRVSLEVAPGETVGLVGESGSGKSTLGRLLAGLRKPTSGTISRSDSLDAADVQVVFQDPYAALNPALTPLSAVTEIFRVKRKLSRRAARDAAADLLARVGIDEEAGRRNPRRLSGGQCQRVAIGRSLAVSPTVLIADEPTSSLDVSVQAQILNLLEELRAERDLAMVLVSHDLDVIRYMADRTYVMNEGRIVESGPTEEIYLAPRDSYTKRLLSGLSN